MHIPDGFVTAPVVLGGAAIAALGLAVCVRRAGRELSPEYEHDTDDGTSYDSRAARRLPLAGLAAAFFVVLEAPIIPIAVGTNGHLLGGTLAVALLGPWLGPIVITVVTVVQTLFTGAGGLSALGVNLVNLALVPAAVGYPVLLAVRSVASRLRVRGRGLHPHTAVALAAGIAATVSVLVAAAMFSAEYAIGGAAGIPAGTVAATTVGVYAVVALAEGVVTALIVRGLLALRADVVRTALPSSGVTG